MIDSLLELFGSFGWITPLMNEVQNYTQLEYSGSYDDALAYKLALERQGIPCRLEGGGMFTNACVYIRPKK